MKLQIVAKKATDIPLIATTWVPYTDYCIIRARNSKWETNTSKLTYII